MFKKRTKHGPIGLDIGAAGIKILQLADVGGLPSVLAAARCDLDPSVDNSNENIASCITTALRQHSFRGNEVITALSTGEFQMKNIRMPNMPAEELASAVEFEAIERFAFPDPSAQIRFLSVGEVRHGDEIKEEIIVFAARDEVVRKRLEMLESLKLRPIAIDIAPLAVARCFIRFLRRSEDADSINMFLDVGYGGSWVVVTRGVDIAFIKHIDVGGRHFNDKVAKALGISKREAADIRIRIMHENGGRRACDESSVPNEIRAAAADAVRPDIERLTRDVQLCMRYFAVTFRGQKPESLTVVGGESHEPSLREIISEVINVPTLIGHPLRGIGRLELISGIDRRSLQPVWAVAGGLALRGSAWISESEGMAHRTQSRPVLTGGAVG